MRATTTTRSGERQYVRVWGLVLSALLLACAAGYADEVRSLTIGFSDAQDGEFDVTEFRGDETVYCHLYDVDLCEDPAHEAMPILYATQVSVRQKVKSSSNSLKLELKNNKSKSKSVESRKVMLMHDKKLGVCKASIDLEGFAEGPVVLTVVCIDGDGLMLMRSSKIYINNDLGKGEEDEPEEEPARKPRTFPEAG